MQVHDQAQIVLSPSKNKIKNYTAHIQFFFFLCNSTTKTHQLN